MTDEETPVITEKDIEAIIEEKTKIPVGDLKERTNAVDQSGR
jgi:ATP-dependent Clp protease ATP-binding subunit ClpE